MPNIAVIQLLNSSCVSQVFLLTSPCVMSSPWLPPLLSPSPEPWDERPSLRYSDASSINDLLDQESRAASESSSSIPDFDMPDLTSLPGPRPPARKTPSQVKAESAARKAKVETGESVETEQRF